MSVSGAMLRLMITQGGDVFGVARRNEILHLLPRVQNDDLK
jgi:hypothetical protein